MRVMLATVCIWHGAMIRTRASTRIGNHLLASGISMKEQGVEHLLDDIGWKILIELQQNARMPFAELGRIVGLSTPAVTERVHKMEEAGIIVGYRAHIDPAKVGLAILAFVNVKVGGENLSRFMEVAGMHPEVLECHRVTGAESFLLKVAVCDVAHLESLLDALMPYVATTTSMVLSTALAWGNIAKPDTKPRPEAVRSRV
jgi:Lrp/AsnC family transcriptional regulator, leucine-responsive regulatory protein